MPYEVETDEALDEMFEADEGADEAARSWFPLRPKVASGQNLYAPRPQSQYVTQQQLQTALAKVGAQVRTNSNAISQFGGRLSSVAASLKKETSDRKKDIASVKSNLSQTQQLTAILPLLTQPRSVSVTGLANDGIPDGTKVLVDGSNTTSLLLPLLLLSSVGDGGSTGTGGGGLFGTGGDNSSLLILALLLGGLGGR